MEIAQRFKMLQSACRQVAARRGDIEAPRKAVEIEVTGLMELLGELGLNLHHTGYKVLEYKDDLDWSRDGGHSEPLVITDNPLEILVYLRELVQVAIDA